MTTVKFYDKDQVDGLLGGKADTTDLPSSSELVPDTTGATLGDVLTVGADGAEWTAPGGGSGGITKTQITTVAQFNAWVSNANLGDFVMLGDMSGVNGIFYKMRVYSATDIVLRGAGWEGSVMVKTLEHNPSTGVISVITVNDTHNITLTNNSFDDACFAYNINRSPTTYQIGRLKPLTKFSVTIFSVHRLTYALPICW